jgi:hypothetical protein
MAPPNTVHDLQRWLGAVNYYSAFIDKYAEITAPLTDLLKGSNASKRKNAWPNCRGLKYIIGRSRPSRQLWQHLRCLGFLILNCQRG